MIDFDLNEVLRYLGAGGRQAPDKLLRDVERVAALVREHVKPRSVWREFPADGIPFRGLSVGALLQDCKRCLLFAITLGSDFDTLLLRLQRSDLPAAVIADACGSAAVEAECDRLCDAFRAQYAAEGLFTTARISPGYGDFALECQDLFCSMLDSRRKIGLAVSAGGLLTPMKSVTALVGLSDKEQISPFPRDCTACVSRETCSFRKAGGSCDGL